MVGIKKLIQKEFWLEKGQWLKIQLKPLKLRYVSFRGKHPRTTFGLKISALAGFAAFFFLFSFSLLVYWGAFGKLPGYPDLRAIQNSVASEVYAEDGVLLGKYFIENRVNADFEDISPNIINALIATEDARFFDHSGIDIRAAFRVFFRTVLLSDESGGGGSTLSQQLAKNLYPRQRFQLFTIPIAKVKEMIVARRLERLYSKEELLDLYLNTVPFSENIFGVKVAAQRFFNTSPKDIKVEEAAVLVGMLKATSTYNPLKHPQRSLLRRNTVLRQMVKYGYLEAEVFDSLKMKPIDLKYFREGDHRGLGTYFREHLRVELDALLKNYQKSDGSPYDLYRDGLKIFTTIDAKMQQYAEEAMREQVANLQKSFFADWKGSKAYGGRRLLRQAKEGSERYKWLKTKGWSSKMIDDNFGQPERMTLFDWKDGGEIDTLLSPLDSLKYYLSILNAGFLAVEPQSGKIRVWIGGIGHRYFQYDHVLSRRQVGSVFKPVVYAKALQEGIPPCDYIDNFHTVYTQYDNWQPKNSDGKYGGVYSMEGGLSHSVNAVTVDIMLRAGIDSVKLLAADLGIEGSIPSVPSICLGTMDASLYEMVQVYGTFANRGRRPELFYLKRIETSDGKTLVKFEPPDTARFERVLSVENSDMLVRMLRSVVDSGTAKRLRYQFRLYNQIAGKTGTTQNQSDGWFIGFTPNLVAGAWVGAESPKVHFRSMRLGQGSNSALPIWGRFMKKLYRDPAFKKWKRLEFPEPDSSLLAMMDCPPFLEDRSQIPSLFGEEEQAEPFFDKLRDLFRMNHPQRHNVNPRRNHRRNKKSERIRRHNERLKKKRRSH